MTDQQYESPPPERERRRAADLRTGDRIVPGDLVGATAVEEVLGVHPFAEPDRGGEPWVFLVVRPERDVRVFGSYFHAEDSFALDAAR